MSNKELRSEIETIIRTQKGAECNGNYKDAHMYYYEIFFSIFSDMKSEYDLLEKPPKFIDFIEAKGRLREYYDVVNGKQDKVRSEYYAQLRTEGERRLEEMWKQDRQEKLIELKEMILSGKSEWHDRCLYIQLAFNDDNLLNSLEEKEVQKRILLQSSMEVN